MGTGVGNAFDESQRVFVTSRDRLRGYGSSLGACLDVWARALTLTRALCMRHSGMNLMMGRGAWHMRNGLALVNDAGDLHRCTAAYRRRGACATVGVDRLCVACRRGKASLPRVTQLMALRSRVHTNV